MEANRGKIIVSPKALLWGLCLWSLMTLMAADLVSAWPTGPSATVPVCTATGNQYGPKLLRVADGYIVAWQDDRRVYRDIYAQKFDIDGAMMWAENGKVIAAGNNGEASNHLLFNSQSLTGLAVDAQGGAIVLWTEDYTCSSGPCSKGWVTRVDADSNVQWGGGLSPGVTIQGTDTAIQLNEHAHADAIAPDGEGGAFIILDYDPWGSWNVFRLDENGAFRSITSNVVGARSGARMIYGGNSGGKDYVSIAWWDYGAFAINVVDPEVNYPASTDTLFAPWTRITLTTTPSWWGQPFLVSDGAGGAIVAWEDGRNGTYDVFVQKVSASGSVQWKSDGVPVAVQPGDQRRPEVVSDGTGGAVVVWEDFRTSPARVYAQHVGADGNVLWAADGIPISTLHGESPKVIKSDDGEYIVVWKSPDWYLRAQKINDAGSLLWPPDSNTTGVIIGQINGEFDVASDGSMGLVAVWPWAWDVWAKRVYPEMAVAPLSRDFGTVEVGDESAQTFTISNTGTVDLVVEAVSLSGTQTSHFATRNDGCTGHIVASGGACTVEVAFTPQSGGVKSALLTAATKDTPALTASLSGAAPPVCSVVANEGAGVTGTTDVTLTLTASGESPGPIEMCIGNTAACGSWEPFSTTNSWSLSLGDGLKTVSVRLRDSLGNTATTPCSDSITLDTTAPAGGHLVPTVAAGQIALQWTGFTDALSGIEKYRLVYALGGTPGTCTSGMFLYEGTGSFFVHKGLPNGVTLYYRVCAYDGAGNGSAVTTSARSLSTCTYQIAPTNQPVDAPGGSGTVTVTTQTGCAWTPVSSDSWITITSGAGSSGSGAVGYQVGENISGGPRAGTITIGVQTLEIQQSDVETHQEILALDTKYYNDVLDRAPEPGAAERWTAEVERIVTRGIDIREGFQALGKVFFNSTEYLSRNKSPEDFVTDLYQTFLNRRPEDPGLDHWVDQLLAGLTRDMLITEFANCEEFKLFLQGILGTMSTRPENNLVNDLYRGFLGRLPDSAGFNHWLKDNPTMNMRSAQCSGAAAVRNLTYQIALAFIQCTEYANRKRDDNQYVEDLYNGILKRGADPTGYTHWVNLLKNRTYTRQQMLTLFTNSDEFQTRVQQVIDAGCLP